MACRQTSLMVLHATILAELQDAREETLILYRALVVGKWKELKFRPRRPRVLIFHQAKGMCACIQAGLAPSFIHSSKTFSLSASSRILVLNGGGNEDSDSAVLAPDDHSMVF